MALKDSFINLNKALRTTLQNVPAVVDTLIRGFDEIGDAADELSTYSTTEKAVGTWTDGSTVYEKTYIMEELPSNTSKSIPIGVTDINKIIGIDAVATHRTAKGNAIPIPNTNPGITIFIGSGNITITTTTGFSAYDGIITLRYTKSAASRSPENDTRNGDDEPDVKTVEEPAEELKK